MCYAARFRNHSQHACLCIRNRDGHAGRKRDGQAGRPAYFYGRRLPATVLNPLFRSKNLLRRLVMGWPVGGLVPGADADMAAGGGPDSLPSLQILVPKYRLGHVSFLSPMHWKPRRQLSMQNHIHRMAVENICFLLPQIYVVRLVRCGWLTGVSSDLESSLSPGRSRH